MISNAIYFYKYSICLILLFTDFILYLIFIKCLLFEVFAVTIYFFPYLYYNSYSIIAKRNNKLNKSNTQNNINIYSIKIIKNIKIPLLIIIFKFNSIKIIIKIYKTYGIKWFFE